jgi:hypothetical protein
VVSAHSIAEIAKTPAAFEQRAVHVRGLVEDVVTRYGETPYTILALSGEEGTMLAVFTWGIPPCKLGDLCHVTGTVVTEKTIDTHRLSPAVEADKVEKVAEAAYKSAGPVFSKKREMGTGRVGKYLQGFSLFP